MRNFFWISCIASTLLLGADRVELFGTVADVNGSVAHVTGDPVISYQDQIINADELLYDRNTSIIEAMGSVNVFKANQYHVLGDYAKIDLLNNTQLIRPYYLFDTGTGLWISTDEAQGCKGEIDLASGALSGCDSTDPIWKIRFSSANYDDNAMWVDLYNARLEIDDVPVFYFPYFGYPTDRTRRSGLLIPYFGISSAEGFYYQQPIYFAPQNWWDLELRPQIRTSRGAGVYADFRFVDTPSSEGIVSVGTFTEQSDYAAEYNLANRTHYGYGLKYRHKAPLREWFGMDLEGESGLYVDGLWMNDVDYLNLQHTNQLLNVTSKQVMSRINGYYNSEENYFGTYLKHYQYLDNAVKYSETIQTLPALHYHRYMKSFLENHLLVNADAMATHFYRPEGKKAIEGNVNVPLVLQTSLLDEFLDLSYTANASGKLIGFYGNERTGETGSDYENGTYAQLDHTVALSTTLVRPYDTLTHVLNPFVSYTFAGSRYYNGYYKTYHDSKECIPGNTNPACDFYTLNDPKDTLSLGVNNYLFDNGKQMLVDRLSQNFVYDNQASYYGELQNELEWEITEALSFYNQTAYNHDRNRITKEQNTVRYNGERVTAGVSHYYTDELRNNVPVYASYWTADAAYQYNRHVRVFGLIAYDYREDLLKRSEVGFLYSQRCLDFGLRYVQNIRPTLTNLTADSLNESYIFITINLKPIGGSEFNYKLTKN